jgi:RNA polymerase sigma-70 factor (ECF subfamily)
MRQNLLIECIPQLRRYAGKLTGDRHSADDLVQDTLERALGRLHLWQPGSNARAWLFSVMRHVFVNHWRARKPEIELDHELCLDHDAHTRPFNRIVIAEVERAMNAISAEQREVLMLVAVEQLSYAQTAEALAIPVGTVMSRLARARENLRRQMNPTRP